MSENDWEVLELNAGLLESGAVLSQVGLCARALACVYWGERDSLKALPTITTARSVRTPEGQVATFLNILTVPLLLAFP